MRTFWPILYFTLGGLYFLIAGCRTQQPLHVAMSYRGSYDVVAAKLAAGERVDQRDQYGRTPLYMAALSGDINLVQLLLNHGADPAKGARWKDGDTALHKAASGGHVDVIELLIEAGVNPNIRNTNRETPLHHAAVFARPESVRSLLSLGADPLVLHRGRGLFGIGKRPPILEIVTRDSDKHLAMIKEFLDAGIDPNISYDRSTPLNNAVMLGAGKVVELLLDRGADINAMNKRLTSPFLLAVRVGNIDMASLLIERGVDLTQYTSRGKKLVEAALEVAIEQNNQKLINFLELHWKKTVESGEAELGSSIRGGCQETKTPSVP